MELTLQPLHYQRLTAQGMPTLEETTEVNISDTLPDAQRIADVQGLVLIRDRVAREGGADVRAVVRLTVLYVPDTDAAAADGNAASSQVVKVEAPLTFHLKAELPGVTPDSQLFCDASLLSADARLLNSRKLHLRAELRFCIRAYEEVTEGLADGAVADENTVETLCRQEDIRFPAAVGSKNMTIIEDVDTAGLGIEELLCVQAQVREETTTPDNGRIELRGKVLLELLFRDHTGLLRSWKTDFPFEQSSELPNVTEEMSGETCYTLKSLETTLNGTQEGQETLNVNLGVTAEIIVFAQETVTLLQDAYSTCQELTLQYEDRTFQSADSTETVSTTVEETVETPAEVVRLICWSLSVPCGGECDGEEISVRVLLRALWQADDGALYGSTRRIPVTLPGTGCAPTELRFAIENDTVKPTENGLLASFTLTASCSNGLPVTVSVVSGIQEGASYQNNCDAALILRFIRAMTLWEIGKAYHVTLESLCRLNGLNPQESKVADGSYLFADGLVLIPQTPKNVEE